MKVSDCCGASHPEAEDYGICPECREHCDFVEEDEEENTSLDQLAIDIHSNYYDNDSDFEIGGEG